MLSSRKLSSMLVVLVLAIGLIACTGGQDSGLLDGDAVDGDETDGDVVDGDESDGDAVDGDETDGDTVDGDETDGDIVDGDDTDGDAVDGDEADGDVVDGDGTDGDAVDGDETDGDAVDGDETDGDAMDGDETDGDAVDGDETDGDTVDGDETDGDVESLCDGVECYDNAICNEVSGDCECEAGYENWTDMLGCTQSAPAIIGSFDDGYGGHHEITTEVWTQSGFGTPSRFFISQYSATEHFAIAFNSLDNPFSAGKWSRFDWIMYSDGNRASTLYYCQTAYAAETEEDALATAAADASSPATGGCAGFAWSQLSSGKSMLELEGSYVDAYEGTHEVSSALWVSGGFGNSSFFHITQFSNAMRYVVAQNNSHNAYSAGLWSRFDWTWFDAGEGMNLWYCQTVYNAETETAALDTPAADASNPPTSGCGGFSWSRITVAPATLVVSGHWQDDYQTSHMITGESWTMAGMGLFHISSYSNSGEYLIAQNDVENEYNAGKWSRMDWTWFDAGSGLELWFCQTSYDSETEQDAEAVPAADASNPTESGCGGFSWSRLLPSAE